MARLALLATPLPGLLAILRRTWALPDAALAFGVGNLVVTAACIGLALEFRPHIARLPSARSARIAAGLLGAAVLIAACYAGLHSFCVLDGSDDPEPVYIPLWPAGRLAARIAEAGGRYQALEMYGSFAIVDDVHRMPTALVFASSLVLWCLYQASAAAMTLSFAFFSFRGVASDGNIISLPRAGPPSRREGMERSFDVFLCYNSRDRGAVRAVAERLRHQGLRPWLDDWELPGGERWQNSLEMQLLSIPSAAIFVGGEGLGPWQEVEIQALVQQFVDRRCRLIPVILESAPARPVVPLFLRAMTWVDFRQTAPDPFDQLVGAIKAAANAPTRDGAPET